MRERLREGGDDRDLLADPSEIDDTAGPPPPTWHEYDFRQRAHHLARGQLRRLEEGVTRAATTAGSGLARVLRQDVHASEARVEVLEWNQALERLPAEMSLYLVDCPALRTSCFLDVSPRFLLASIERLLGSRPSASSLPVRALTLLEERLAAPILRRLASAFDHGFGDAGALLGLELVDIDEAASPRRGRFREAPAVVLSFVLTLGSIRGRIELIVPHGPLLPYLCGPAPGDSTLAADGGDAPPAEDLSGALRDRIAPVPVEVAVDLTTEPLPLPALLALRPGDIIDTGRAVESAVDIRVGDRRIGRGRVGREEGRLAVRILPDTTGES